MIPLHLGQMLSESARRFPKRTALVFGSKKITYAGLDELTSRIATGLISQGIGKGDRIAVFLDNCPEFIISYYSILKASATVVPINFMFKMEEAKYILQDSGATGIVTSRALLDTVKELRLRVDTLKYIFCCQDTQESGAHGITGFSYLKRHSLHTKVAPPEPGDAAIILYTSGTTGHPKGAMLTHYNLISNAADCRNRLNPLGPRDSFICILPLFHSFAATVCMNLPILLGAKIVVMKSVRPFKRVIRAVRKNRVTIFVGIPSIYTVLKNTRIPRILHTPLIKLLNPVRICISGAAALPPATLKSFETKFRVPLIEGYGLTEASPVVTLNPIRGPRKPGSIGKLLSDSGEIKIVDENGRELETGKVGELIVKGPSVMAGYYHQPEATSQTIKNGWLYTGDMARIDHQGFVYIAGRKKEMVNVRGLNVYPREIEEVLYQNPKIKEAAVIGIPDEHKGEVPKGFIVLQDAATATEHEMIRYLRDRLAPYKIPKNIEFRKSLPKNASGKILKRLLQDEESKKSV